ncbi:Unknown protein [Striga hermonthica]|uniref:Uncharacterized protein n=1 Tax=Striga hermonthica TaxID=68872 RepID=A0A9N7NU22_STRHE|nr:Unknown protein [Striga hermonthica]
MADQNPDFSNNRHTADAIESAEQFLMLDENPVDCHDPLIDDFLNDVLRDPNEDTAGEYGARFSGAGLERNVNGGESGNFPDFARNNWAPENPVRIPIWPVPPSPYSCTCCQTLREFIHTNGAQVLKLDVHGRLGLISHAVLERFNRNVLYEDHEFYMFDFCLESISSVKQFLVQYCEDRKREGYVMLQDPLSNFYNALCIGLIDGNGSSPHPDIFPPRTSGGDRYMNQGDSSNQPEQDGCGVSKSYLASQVSNKIPQT